MVYRASTNKFLTLTVSLLLLSTELNPALAGTIKVTADTSGFHLANGSARVTKIGGLFGSDLSVFVDGNVIDIQENKDGKKITIASGVVFSDKAVSTAKGQKLTGFWYCRSGERQDDITGRSAETKDVLITTDGARLIGKIAKVNRTEMIVATADGEKTVATRNVARISSSRVFEFSCILKGVNELDVHQSVDVEVDQFLFKPSYDAKLSKSVEKQIDSSDQTRQGKQGWSKKKKIIVFTALILLVATAIAVPIAVAVPLANRRDDQFTLPLQPVLQTQQGQIQQNQN